MDLREQIDRLDRDELAKLRGYIDDKLNPASSVEKRINYRNGWLQSEYRHTDKGTRRGPYWYFKYIKDGQNYSLYIGKSDNPKSEVDQILASKAG
ncbi:MAG: hypothetical protein M3151_13120 [Actinomycetota bacterium]|nr:hypothetical protein [Actinomycetota bacterium]